MTSQLSVEDLRNKMKQAADLETQLESLPKKASEESSSRIRMQLCEILSDVMLQDPYFAMRKDCAGRLWRYCFYGRITQLRNRINREKRKKGPALKKLESSLKVFLQEAIVLYRWIVNKYETKLLPQLPDSQLSQESAVSLVTPEDVAGVIPVLYRLLIHLGDLNRYAGSYNDASTCYDEASKLAPGKGNPYNQLAVVAQMKDPSSPLSCVSLYWYTRSLLAVDGPFETSKTNLALLFDLNRKWLAEHKEEPAAATGTSKKALQQQARAEKSAKSQRFLALFVDVHYYFFQVSDEKEIVESTLKFKLQDLFERFTYLLDATAFGDALIMKMIAVNAFSVHNLKGKGGCFELSMVLLLKFGASLLQRVQKTLQKVVPATKQHAPATMPSVRLVVPLVLLCDYLYTFHDRHLLFENSRDSLAVDAVNSFWGGIASAANMLTVVRDQLHPSSVQHLRMKEYDSLIGYTPFHSFVSRGKGKKNEAFVSADEAVRALELSPSMTQESAASISSGNDEENRLKLVRFLQVVDRFVRRWEKRDTCLLARDEDGGYRTTALDAATDTLDEADQDATFDDVVDMDIAETKAAKAPRQEEDDDDAGDVVMYKPTEGNGPALLVPGPLLAKGQLKVGHSQAKAMPMTSESESCGADTWKATGNESTGVDMSALLHGASSRLPLEVHHAPPPLAPTNDPMDIVADQHTSKAIPPPPGIMPPPGFAGATSSSGASLASSTSAGGIPTPPPPGFTAQSVPTQQSMHTNGFDLSNLTTANPFASEYPQPSLESLLLPGSGIFGSAYGEPRASSDFLLDVNRKDDASLVETPFLTNLWLEESQKRNPPLSENPFLT